MKLDGIALDDEGKNTNLMRDALVLQLHEWQGHVYSFIDFDLSRLLN